MKSLKQVKQEIAEVYIEFEETKWQPTPDADISYIDFDVVRKGMDKILAKIDGFEKELRSLHDRLAKLL